MSWQSQSRRKASLRRLSCGPWIFGEGPNMVSAGAFHGDSVASLGAKDVRFTRTKDNRVIYAIILGLPSQEMTVEALGL